MVAGETPFPAPIALGHECVAEVVEVGDGVRGARPGALVSVPFQVSCGECVACRRGHTANCRTVPPFSMYGFGQAGSNWGGFLSDVVRVPYADHMLVPLPAGTRSRGGRERLRQHRGRLAHGRARRWSAIPARPC